MNQQQRYREGRGVADASVKGRAAVALWVAVIGGAIAFFWIVGAMQ